jgi:hypothetical protein
MTQELKQNTFLPTHFIPKRLSLHMLSKNHQSLSFRIVVADLDCSLLGDGLAKRLADNEARVGGTELEHLVTTQPCLLYATGKLVTLPW